MRIALKVDVDTLRGTLEGVPALLRLFDTYGVKATFLFSVGPDHTGRALRRIFRPGFLAKVRRTSVASHYGLKTLLYGTLLPGPDVGRRGAEVMRSAAEAGHEVGVHCYDHIKWHDYVPYRDEAWTQTEMERAAEAFLRIFGELPKVHGAAGWQVNPHALALEERMGFDCASDTRGKSAFFPVLQGIRSGCPQIPTTLPTLDELIGRDGITAENAHQFVFAESQYVLPQGQVYTLHAELEGMKLLSVMERLLVMWRSQGELRTLGQVYRELDLSRLPTHQVGWGELPGRSGYLAMQGLPVPS
jgi:peptidoglycan/xylan/chitin deacetylase (PgdA/CDA1 family)